MKKKKKTSKEINSQEAAYAYLERARKQHAEWEKKHSKEEKKFLKAFHDLTKLQKDLVFQLMIGLADLPEKNPRRVSAASSPSFRSIDCPTSGPGDPGFIPGPGGI